MYDQPPLFLDTPKQCAAKNECEITEDARGVKRACNSMNYCATMQSICIYKVLALPFERRANEVARLPWEPSRP